MSAKMTSFNISHRTKYAKCMANSSKSPPQKFKFNSPLTKADKTADRTLLNKASQSKLAKLFKLDFNCENRRSVGEKSRTEWSLNYRSSGFTERAASSLASKSQYINSWEPLQKLQLEKPENVQFNSITQFDPDTPYLEPFIKPKLASRRPLYEPPATADASEKRRRYRLKDTADPFTRFMKDNKDRSFTGLREKPELTVYSMKGVDDRAAANAVRRQQLRVFKKDKTEMSAHVRDVRQMYFKLKNAEAVDNQLAYFSQRKWLTLIYLYKVINQLDNVADRVIENRRLTVRRNIASRLVIRKGDRNSISRLSENYPDWDNRDIQRSKQ